ncbi:hypothetical protein MycrhDRAFT_6975 [Mycolicibacterium rhodesiae JS60]|nr:hypothetical protein MycrhDRAFT_6975 [Mycolicibacterium rhodesiae JS60]
MVPGAGGPVPDDVLAEDVGQLGYLAAEPSRFGGQKRALVAGSQVDGSRS